ncbi:MAG: pyridoxal phosphate-dependent aminotransferase [Terriglobia bacterium]
MISKKAREMPPFIVMEILEKAQEMERAGQDIVHLEIGEPDFATPACIREAACQAIEKGQTRYTHSLGLVELREAIAHHYRTSYGVDVTADRVVVTTGTSPGMLQVFGSLIDKGDEVILPNPYYSCYPNFIRFAEGVPTFVQVSEGDGFQYRPEMIRQKLTRRTKAILVNSPANPTGAVLTPDRIKAIAGLAPDNCFIVSDEIYHGLVYEGKEHTALEYTDRAFVINGFSKLYAMTGWRLGYVIAPPEFMRPLQKLQQNFFISANSFVQWAGLAALEKGGADVLRMKNTYNKRRRLMLTRLREIGFGVEKEPTGAFYILANARAFSDNSYELAFDILKHARVAVTPGVDFGDGAEGYLRFTYASSAETIEKGMKRLKEYLRPA